MKKEEKIEHDGELYTVEELAEKFDVDAQFDVVISENWFSRAMAKLAEQEKKQ